MKKYYVIHDMDSDGKHIAEFATANDAYKSMTDGKNSYRVIFGQEVELLPGDVAVKEVN